MNFEFQADNCIFSIWIISFNQMTDWSSEHIGDNVKLDDWIDDWSQFSDNMGDRVQLDDFYIIIYDSW